MEPLEPLGFSNFFNHFYIIDTENEKLSKKDQTRALGYSILLGVVTLGLVHLVCAITKYCITQIDKNDNPVAERIDSVGTDAMYRGPDGKAHSPTQGGNVERDQTETHSKNKEDLGNKGLDNQGKADLIQEDQKPSTTTPHSPNSPTAHLAKEEEAKEKEPAKQPLPTSSSSFPPPDESLSHKTPPPESPQLKPIESPEAPSKTLSKFSTKTKVPVKTLPRTSRKTSSKISPKGPTYISTSSLRPIPVSDASQDQEPPSTSTSLPLPTQTNASLKLEPEPALSSPDSTPEIEKERKDEEPQPLTLVTTTLTTLQPESQPHPPSKAEEELERSQKDAVARLGKQVEDFRKRQERQEKLMESFKTNLAQLTSNFQKKINEIKDQNNKAREAEKIQSKENLDKNIRDAEESLNKQFEEEKKEIEEKYRLQAQQEEENKKERLEGLVPKKLENDFDLRSFDKATKRKQENLSREFESKKELIIHKYDLKMKAPVFEGDWENSKARRLTEAEKNTLEERKNEALQEAEEDYIADRDYRNGLYQQERKLLLEKRYAEIELEELEYQNSRKIFSTSSFSVESSHEREIQALTKRFEKAKETSERELTSSWKDQEVQRDLEMIEKNTQEEMREWAQYDATMSKIFTEGMDNILEKNISRLFKIPVFSNLPEGEFKKAYDEIKKMHESGQHKELFKLQDNYTKEDVEHGFRQLCLKVHPDKNRDLLNESGELTTFLTLIKEDLISSLSV